MKVNEIKCQDCKIYLKSIPDNFVDLIIIDPPYNVSKKNSVIRMKDRKSVNYDFGDWDYDFDPKEIMPDLKRVLKPNGSIYIFTSTKLIAIYHPILEKEWRYRSIITWVKTNPVPKFFKNGYLSATEFVLYAVNKKDRQERPVFNFKTQAEMKNVFITSALQGKERLKDENNKTLHPTQKPLSLVKHLIEISSNEGDIVMDCFLGTGTTAVASKMLNRNYIGCEFDEKYFKVIQERLKTIQPS